MSNNQANRQPPVRKSPGRGRPLSDQLFVIPQDFRDLLAPTSVTSPIAAREDREAELPDASAFSLQDRFKVAVKCALQRMLGEGTPSSQLAARLGRSWKQVTRYLTDDVEIPAAVLREVADAAELPLEWVLNGRRNSLRTSGEQDNDLTAGLSTADQTLREVRKEIEPPEPDFDLPTSKLEMAERIREVVGDLGGIARVAQLMGVSFARMEDIAFGVDATPLELATLSMVSAKSVDWLVFGREQASTGRSTAVDLRDDFAFLPRYSARAAAGSGQLAVSEEVTDILAFRRDWLRKSGINPAHAFLLIADGDSMTPTIPDGALMLVDGSIREPRDIRNGMIYVLVRSGTVIVKRIQFRLDDSIVLISDNPVYERETISRDDMNDLTFAGRVVWIGRAI